MKNDIYLLINYLFYFDLYLKKQEIFRQDIT